MKVFVHLAEGFEEVEAITVIDFLRRAEVKVSVLKVGDEETLVVKGAHGISVIAEEFAAKADYSQCEMLVLPGGMPGTSNLGADKVLMSNLKKLYDQDKWICAICAAPMVLAKEGILRDKNATIYPGMEEFLEGANPTGQLVEKDGKIITGRGPGAATEFALALIEVLCGKKKSDEIREGLAG